MSVAEITKQMIDYSKGNRRDINHFLKVYAYAKTIGECEGLDPETQLTLEVAAIVHDIACPLCREKYGNTNGKYQEAEGMVLAAEFLKDTGLPQACLDRVVYLVGHHHTLTDVEGLDYQILLEADYLVNADEHGYSRENVENTLAEIFRTATGSALLRAVYQIG